MTTEVKTKWPDLFCIGWGKLRLKDDGTHKSCPVVFLTSESTWESAIKGDLLASGRSFPMVCPCDCKTCKRAWWEAGRPILKDGAIITTLT
jgi:hypothetical protein